MQLHQPQLLTRRDRKLATPACTPCVNHHANVPLAYEGLLHMRSQKLAIGAITVILLLVLLPSTVRLYQPGTCEGDTCMGGALSRSTPELSMAAKSFVDKAIKDNRVMVFSKSYCPFCKKAKTALNSVMPQSKYVVEELDHRQDGGEIQDYLLQLTGGRSVPRVFVDGAFLGGGDDTAAKAQNGELKQLLTSKGII